MQKTYDPEAIEQRWYETWEANGWFAPSGVGVPYCIMIPPPNVTGTLHMGHAFQDTIMDVLIRRHRMAGRDTLWQPGADHAGIATQMVVERQLAREDLTRHDLGRDAFVERVWEWKAESGGIINRQLRRLGASPDWTRERFTMDEGMSAAVQEVFIRLYDEGLIYRGNRLVNWDPVLHTALSDIEVLSEEEDGYLWHFRYPLENGDGHLVVATTRPETMLGDTAVAVHPEDERFSPLVGQHIRLPLVDRLIPIVADDYVDPEFGSGCVKITPAHDFNDNALGRRHDLPEINVFTHDAAMNDAVPEAYRGLDRYEARRRIVADLDALGLVEKIEAHKLMVPRGDRSGAVIEPWLTDQWFVDLTRDTQSDGRPGGAASITKPAIDAVRSGRVRFVPGNWANTYYQWLENIEDWCISRQLWWGHRIPAWYDDSGTIYVGRSERDVRERHDLDADIALRQDEDVLDTWFSSALWPFSTLGWPENTEALQRYYPGSVLVTGFDIIFFWVARMIMFGVRFMDGEVPFHDVYMHGLVRDAEGRKMSKSKGNVLDPLDIIDGITLDALIEKRTSALMQPHLAPRIEKETRKHFPDGIPGYGTDALRFTFASLATTGRDVRFDLKRVEGSRNFCNKLYNATRFVLMNTEGFDAPEPPTAAPAIDRWIRQRFATALEEIERAFDGYRFDLAATALYEFVWNEYCDWYVEMAKATLAADATEADKQAVRYTLLDILERTLRLAHPVLPFITEELWQAVAPRIGRDGPSISLTDWPGADETLDEAAGADIEWLRRVVMGVRRIRSEMNIAPGKRLPLITDGESESDHERLARHAALLISLARLSDIASVGDAVRPDAAVALVDDLQLLIPMAGLIDRDAELERLDRELDKLRREADRLERKLANTGFTDKAPAAVVEAERDKLVEARSALARLGEQRERIAGM